MNPKADIRRPGQAATRESQMPGMTEPETPGTAAGDDTEYDVRWDLERAAARPENDEVQGEEEAERGAVGTRDRAICTKFSSASAGGPAPARGAAMTAVETLARWLEEDGHPGCASALVTAGPEDRPRAARAAADCAENDPDAYDDGIARHLPAQLREWAAAHQDQPPA